MNLPNQSSAAADVAQCQRILAHAWMVRTFVKHSPEVEEFPELMDIVRSVFDLSRALETRVDDPVGYFRMLHKKLGSLREASGKFAHDAPLASGHTNFQQAVISIAACVDSLAEILEKNYAPPAPPPSKLPALAPARGESALPCPENQPENRSPSAPAQSDSANPQDRDLAVNVEVQEEIFE